MSTLLTIVRHGETSANLDGVWHGSIDTPLTARGQAQAAAVGAFLAARDPAAALYASPLQRAMHTAEAIAKATGLEPRTEPDLSEFHLGEWEGKTYHDLYNAFRLWHHMKDDPDYAPHGGESPRQVTDRLIGALRRIADAHAGERVVVVSHGGALSMAFGYLLDGDYSEWRRVMSNCAVTDLALDPEPELLAFNLVDHLDGI